MHIPTYLPLTFLLTPTAASVLLLLSTQPGGLGLSKSYIVNRWQCDTLVAPMDKNTSWAFVASGLANGKANCTGKNLYIAKNNGNVLGPGPVNLTDFEFEDVASSFSCV
ncbi:hypothetical protein HRS9122_08249 [Pyrenophora teres f. teres]|nr:hypothetical protein HRS9122_08249 [Pyrenophora teres f. teres]CAA9967051.1 hypothetical protein PTMSG1_10410 [Pyrenophora teres f. maculata]